MLTAKYELAEQGITVPYDRRFKGLQRNFGFVDVRGRPDLVSQIPEAAQSNSLKALLMALAESTAPVFTVGCDLGTRKDADEIDHRFVAGGYLHVLSASFANTSAEAYLALARRISARVEEQSAGHVWELLHLYAPVDFKLVHTGIVPSVEIWFDARAKAPDAAWRSRELLIDVLRDSLSSEPG